MTMRPSPVGHRGMTLIEVMLAVAILATIMVITWGAVSTSFKVRTATIEKFDRFRNVQLAMNRMARELSMAFITLDADQLPTTDGEIVYRTTFEGEEDSIDFTSLSHVRMYDDEVASEQCEISYRLDTVTGDDGKQHHSLVRREQAPVDDKPDKGGTVYTLIEDVEDVRFEYWDSTTEVADEAWVDSWDFKQHNGQLPSRVRITVEIEQPLRRDKKLKLSTETPINLIEPIDPVAIEATRQVGEAREQAVQNLQNSGALPLAPQRGPGGSPPFGGGFRPPLAPQVGGGGR